MVVFLPMGERERESVIRARYEGKDKKQLVEEDIGRGRQSEDHIDVDLGDLVIVELEPGLQAPVEDISYVVTATAGSVMAYDTNEIV